MARLYCGAGKAIITPDKTVLPIPPMGTRPTISDVLDDLYVRVIALKADEEMFLLIGFDLGGPPSAQAWSNELAEKYQIPRKNILYFATHAHATIMIRGEQDPESEVGKKLAIVLDGYHRGLVSAVDEAVNNLQPAHYGIGYGQSYININRNKIYKQFDETGKVIREYCALGWRQEGPSDKTAAVIRFETDNGNPIAFFINYAVHNTGMHGNCAAEDGGMALSSDIGGLCSQYMEEHFPGSVAMWSPAAAGDQNPIMMSQQYYTNYKTGEMAIVEQVCGTGEVINSIKGGGYDLTKTQASVHFDDVLRIVREIKCNKDEAVLKSAVGVSRTPALDMKVDQFAKRSTKDIFAPFDAEQYGISKDTTYDINVHLMEIGDIALVGFDGELYSSIGSLLKSVSPSKNTLIVTHDRPAGDETVGYIYDDEGCTMGGNGGLYRSRSTIVPGYVPSSLCKVMLELFKETGGLLNKK